MNYLKPSELTKENFYDALRPIQNHPECVNQDIVTFTAFLSFEEKVEHYTRYLKRVLEANVGAK